jgi:cystathionine gamma-lyase
MLNVFSRSTRSLLKSGRPSTATVPLWSLPTNQEQQRSKATVSGEWVGGELGQETKGVHGGVNPDPETGAVLTPIYYSTTFVQESVDKYLEKGYSYSRSGNPTVRALEERIAGLENGYGATCVSTGMAATTTVICGTMNAGDHCVISDCSYGGTNRICREHFAVNMGMEFDFVDFRDPEIVRAHIKPNTKLIFSETPTNPTLNLVDIEAISDIAKEHGIVHCVDATFATPVICRPLDHGADLTLQSTTKFYDGHNITVGGAVIAKTKELDDRMHMVQNMHGNIMSPMNAFLQMQTTKTMTLRVRQQSATAMKIATFLESHEKVTKVVYPGLASHPQKELADKYHRDNLHGAMLWFDVKGGDTSAIKLMNTCQRPWSLCENLGATESIITACAVMTHANMLKEDRQKVGISDGFIRVSCGIEDSDDLIRALSESLDQL